MTTRTTYEVEEKLDDRYEKYFAPLVKKYKMKILEKVAYQSFASISAKSGNIVVSLGNDRGLLELEISPSWAEGDENTGIDMGHFAVLLGDVKRLIPQGNICVDLKDAFKSLDKHWDEIQNLFSKKSFKSTLKEYMG